MCDVEPRPRIPCGHFGQMSASATGGSGPAEKSLACATAPVAHAVLYDTVSRHGETRMAGDPCLADRTCLWPPPFSATWHCAHLVLKILAPFLASPGGASAGERPLVNRRPHARGRLVNRMTASQHSAAAAVTCYRYFTCERRRHGGRLEGVAAGVTIVQLHPRRTKERPVESAVSPTVSLAPRAILHNTPSSSVRLPPG
jgi:hypothetical protein